MSELTVKVHVFDRLARMDAEAFGWVALLSVVTGVPVAEILEGCWPRSIGVTCGVCGQRYVLTGCVADRWDGLVPNHHAVGTWLALSADLEVPFARAHEVCRGSGHPPAEVVW